MSALNAGLCRPGIILCLAVLLASQSNSGKFSSVSTEKDPFTEKVRRFSLSLTREFYLRLRLLSSTSAECVR